MTAYNSQGSWVTSVFSGDATKVWDAETPTPGNGAATGSASRQLALTRTPEGGLTPFTVDGFFSAAPGAFEIDVQTAADDVDSEYQTISGGQIITVDAVNQTFHFCANAESDRFVRLLMRSRTNNVTVTAKIKR